ncbi:unnamed protein product [Trichogramma brassicae]|uniref:Reverse transcriptase Ty1/copia-type domain-containing protein n=1 Tax=Trichogramma brassicae TaxID=86971 RepID=A0A6H5J206_9HYME|nr:unnamed protein product [Trichogramma brassicae]
MSLSDAAKEAIYLSGLLTELGFTDLSRTIIYNDNQSAGKLATNPVFHARSKHIDIRAHFVREVLKDGKFTLEYLPTEDMIADILTKALPKPKTSSGRSGNPPKRISHISAECSVDSFKTRISDLSRSISFAFSSIFTRDSACTLSIASIRASDHATARSSSLLEWYFASASLVHRLIAMYVICCNGVPSGCRRYAWRELHTDFKNPSNGTLWLYGRKFCLRRVEVIIFDLSPPRYSYHVCDARPRADRRLAQYSVRQFAPTAAASWSNLGYDLTGKGKNGPRSDLSTLEASTIEIIKKTQKTQNLIKYDPDFPFLNYLKSFLNMSTTPLIFLWVGGLRLPTPLHPDQGLQPWTCSRARYHPILSSFRSLQTSRNSIIFTQFTVTEVFARPVLETRPFGSAVREQLSSGAVARPSSTTAHRRRASHLRMARRLNSLAFLLNTRVYREILSSILISLSTHIELSENSQKNHGTLSVNSRKTTSKMHILKHTKESCLSTVTASETSLTGTEQRVRLDKVRKLGVGSIPTRRSTLRSQHSHDEVRSENHTHKRAPDAGANAQQERMMAPEARTTLTR